MKKAYLFIIMFLFLAICGCAQNKVTNVEVVDIPNEVVVGKFDQANIYYLLSWTDGSSTKVQITKNSLPESEQAKLDQPGVVTLSYYYEGYEVNFDIKLVRHSSNPAEKNHDYVVISEVLPTCTEDGSQELLCDCGISTTRKVKALEHDLAEEVVVREATCSEEGLNQQFCKREGCGHVEDVKVKKIDCVQSDWIVDTEATCDAAGSRHIECTECHKVIRTESIAKLNHDMSDWVVTVPATCVRQGTEERYCDRVNCNHKESRVVDSIPHVEEYRITTVEVSCVIEGKQDLYCANCEGMYKTETIPWVDHVDSDSNHYCDVCSALLGEDNPYYLDSIDKVVFGSYPQEKVTDDALIARLSTLTGKLPSASNANKWIGYNYVRTVGLYEEMIWYKDITLGNFKYRAIYFTQYRGEYTNKEQSAHNSYQDDNGYIVEKLYFFKFTPIKWNLLKGIENEYTIMADLALDTLEYNNYVVSQTIDGQIVYSNNYEHSSIRKFLNDDFYNLAFNTAAKEFIVSSLVKNETDSDYSSNNTSDNVYILSEEEYKLYLNSQTFKASDYSLALGCEKVNGNVSCLLRTPYLENSTGSLYVNTEGVVVYDYVNKTSNGIIPVITIKIALE